MTPATDQPRIPLDSFGNRLAMIRAELQLNVKEMAERCGVNASSLSNWEHGMNCRNMPEIARKISDATGYDYAWIMAGGMLRSR